MLKRTRETQEDYEKAVDFVRRHAVTKHTTSRVSKHLGLGFNASARLVERMEAEGVLSECDSMGRRQVFQHGRVGRPAR